MDPYCEHCLGLSGAEVCDLEHFFCACSRVRQVWERLKVMIAQLLNVQGTDLPDSDLINLRLPRNTSNNEIVWLIGIYVGEVWSCLVIKSAAKLSVDKFFGFLKFKYKTDQLGARLPLSQIPGLL